MMCGTGADGERLPMMSREELQNIRQLVVSLHGNDRDISERAGAHYGIRLPNRGTGGVCSRRR